LLLFIEIDRAKRVQNLLDGLSTESKLRIEERRAMGTVLSQGSATIYQFPVGGRKAVTLRREEANIAADAKLPRLSGEIFGSAWYHEAAIQESKRPGER
jgi:hypothetical protein